MAGDGPDRLLALRNELVDKCASHSVEALFRLTLDRLEELTESRIGFFHFVDPDQEQIHLQVWSSNTVKDMCTTQPASRHYPVSQAGVWADCIRSKAPTVHNDYPRLSHRKGLPEGHAPILRELVTPVLRDDRVVAIFGVGNKPSDYTENDVRVVQVAAAIVFDVVLRKQAEQQQQRLLTALQSLYAVADIIAESGSLDELFLKTVDLLPRACQQPDRVCARITYDDRAFASADFQETPWVLSAEMLVDGRARGIVELRYREAPAADYAGAPVPEEHGVIRAVAERLGRVAERKEAEAERDALRERLVWAEKMETLGLLAGGIAHDYGNILAATSMKLALLEGQPGLSREARLAVDGLTRLNDRASKLTHQLLTFSRRSVINVRPVDLNQLLADVSQLLGRLIGDRVEVVVHATPDLPPVQADGAMIEQVVTNLLINARDAMPEGGRIDVRTSVVQFEAGQRGTDGEARGGSFACLTVADTGVGMSADVRHRVFEPFFTTKPPGKGTGLGLATAFGTVKQHGGWIDVESEVGVGTAFHIFLPIR